MHSNRSLCDSFSGPVSISKVFVHVYSLSWFPPVSVCLLVSVCGRDVRVCPSTLPVAHQIMRIRKMLTEILLEVTNKEIAKVAGEAIEEAKSKC